jgi:hypothetical protein
MLGRSESRESSILHLVAGQSALHRRRVGGGVLVAAPLVSGPKDRSGQPLLLSAPQAFGTFVTREPAAFAAG